MKQITVRLNLAIFFLTLSACSGAIEEQRLTCKDLTSQYELYEGREITIQALSWGISQAPTREIYLSLGDTLLSGLQMAKVVVVFPTDEEVEVKKVLKDSEVRIRATVGVFKYGAIYLTNPTVQ